MNVLQCTACDRSEPFFEPGALLSAIHRSARPRRAHGGSRHVPVRPRRPRPGLRVFRFLRPPRMTRHRDRPVVKKLPLDLTLPRGVPRAATENRRGAFARGWQRLGVVLAGLLGLPHRTTCTRLPHRYEFRYSSAPAHRRVQRQGASQPRSNVVIVICRARRSLRASTPHPPVLIENARLGRWAPTAGSGLARLSGSI